MTAWDRYFIASIVGINPENGALYFYTKDGDHIALILGPAHIDALESAIKEYRGKRAIKKNESS